VALMVQGLDGASPAEVAAIPDDMVGHLGLQRVLGMTRQQGFRGVVARIKRAIRRQPVPSTVVAP
jgi:cysteine desulfuration protein SufE